MTHRAALEAHFRLTQQLQRRTHEWRPPAPPPPHRIIPENFKDRRSVRIEGRTYDSISRACRRYNCSPRKIYQWIESGKARFL